ncbi:MAG: hypothetical protein JW700_00540 [Candidatus Aenigmarchaeota archaeon]|nr:hypothetical protein [Candidatus Aenigmarchaeota archaeon]
MLTTFFSISGIISIILGILLGTVTAWISAYIVDRRASFQGALLFSAVSYVAMILFGYIPTISLPFISTYFLIDAVIKSVLAMKFFGTDFRSGLSITAVQMLLGMIITII